MTREDVCFYEHALLVSFNLGRFPSIATFWLQMFKMLVGAFAWVHAMDGHDVKIISAAEPFVRFLGPLLLPAAARLPPPHRLFPDHTVFFLPSQHLRLLRFFPT